MYGTPYAEYTVKGCVTDAGRSRASKCETVLGLRSVGRSHRYAGEPTRSEADGNRALHAAHADLHRHGRPAGGDFRKEVEVAFAEATGRARARKLDVRAFRALGRRRRTRGENRRGVAWTDDIFRCVNGWGWNSTAGFTARRWSGNELRTLFWECTLRCNLRCGHCGSDCTASPDCQDMPAEDFFRVLDRQITPRVDPHRVMVVLSGGEVLVRSDLERIGRALYDREYPWGMVTNGMALTPQRFDGLLAAGLHSMTVSIDGFEAEHNRLRRHPLSFARAAEAVRMAAAEPSIAFDAVTCVTPALVPRLDEFKGVPALAGAAELAAVRDLSGGTRRRRPCAATLRRAVPCADGVRPPHAAQGRIACSYASRRVSGRLRDGGARPFLPLRRRCVGGLDPCRRRHLGLYVGAGRLCAGAISTATISGRCGPNGSNPSAAANGCVGVRAPTALRGATARAARCTCATPTEG